jgi:hypothetical protein
MDEDETAPRGVNTEGSWLKKTGRKTYSTAKRDASGGKSSAWSMSMKLIAVHASGRVTLRGENPSGGVGGGKQLKNGWAFAKVPKCGFTLSGFPLARDWR